MHFYASVVSECWFSVMFLRLTKHDVRTRCRVANVIEIVTAALIAIHSHLYVYARILVIVISSVYPAQHAFAQGTTEQKKLTAKMTTAQVQSLQKRTARLAKRAKYVFIGIAIIFFVLVAGFPRENPGRNPRCIVMSHECPWCTA